jgi:hypothetical protein
MAKEEVLKSTGVYAMKDKGLNDLEKKIYLLERANFRLTEENNMLKKEITFLREENEAVDLKNIIKCKEEMSERLDYEKNKKGF